jgi:hypothetical protein
LNFRFWIGVKKRAGIGGWKRGTHRNSRNSWELKRRKRWGERGLAIKMIKMIIFVESFGGTGVGM